MPNDPGRVLLGLGLAAGILGDTTLCRVICYISERAQATGALTEEEEVWLILIR